MFRAMVGEDIYQHHIVQGKTHKETAKAIGLNEATVSKRTQRARKAVKKKFGSS